jgi:ATP-dependent 26S proteasome regulatory subunit
MKISLSRDDIRFANDQLTNYAMKFQEFWIYVNEASPMLFESYRKTLNQVARASSEHNDPRGVDQLMKINYATAWGCTAAFSAVNREFCIPFDTKAIYTVDLETMTITDAMEGIDKITQLIASRLEPNEIGQIYMSGLETVTYGLDPLVKLYALNVIFFFVDMMSKTEEELMARRKPFKKLVHKKNLPAKGDPNTRPDGSSDKRRPQNGQQDKETPKFEPVNITQKISLKDIGGQDDAVQRMGDICMMLAKKGPKRWGSSIPRGILFFGDPGCGKTLLGKAIACEFGLPFFVLKSSEIFDKWLGNSEKNIEAWFTAVEEASGIGFIDEADSLCRSRDADQQHEVSRSVINLITQRLDGFNENTKGIYIFATNRPEDMDSAITRPGRVDLMIQIKLPNEKGRLDILNIHKDKAMARANAAGNNEVFGEVDWAHLARITDGFSGAELANIIEQAFYLKDCLEARNEGQAQPALVTADFANQINKTKKDKADRKKGLTISGFGN